MREIGPLLGATTQNMPGHIQGGATRQRAGFHHIPAGRGVFSPGPRRERLVGDQPTAPSAP